MIALAAVFGLLVGLFVLCLTQVVWPHDSDWE